MGAPSEILELMDRFREHAEAYRSSSYNETQVRREFVDPFFHALGWDVDNERSYAEAYKDVVHEDAIKIGGSTKAPDYSFRIGGVRKFFVETKKPSVNVKDDISPAFQLRRYAWSAKLPLSILTDFEEFAVYDCRLRPAKNDSASKGRTLYLTYDEYDEKWDDIAAIFSRDAILKGSFDKYAESNKRKRGTAEVDAAFLDEIETWRSELAKNIARRNPDLSQRELNTAVQKTIDRIVFLRICEDRGIELYGRLQSLLNGPKVYPRLCQLFEEADHRYNSGLFHFHTEKGRTEQPDQWTLKLDIDDAVLKGVIRKLYYPESPYEFSVLGADILGQVYEQFLGKVIRLTKGHQAKIEDKPEVKKAGGVYYTPTYIVDYIVQNTVGKLLDGKAPHEVAGRTEKWNTAKNLRPLTVLDPACGSGSFLIGAYQYLLDWYLRQYSENEPDRWLKGKAPKIYEVGRKATAANRNFRLTTDERKRILLDHIYGVDIDSQAVEVTKLSLLLKVLEGETQETLQRQLFAKQRALPDLAGNIKCGNSLIGPDFYQGRQMDMFDEEERLRINAFDWRAEFAEIMQSGGFDAVIGNPPWGALFSDAELEYHRVKNRKIIVRMIDSFMYFLYQSLNKVRPKGMLGMILPDVILYQKDNEKLRRFVLSENSLEAALNMGDVFEKVTRPSSILVISASTPNVTSLLQTADFTDVSKTEKPAALLDTVRFNEIDQSCFLEIPGALIVTKHSERYAVWRRILETPHIRLGDAVDAHGIQRGVSPDLKDAFLVSSNVADRCSLEKEKLRPVVTGGRHVKRYRIEHPDLFLIYTSRHDDFSALPNICAFIDEHKSSITCREVKQGKHPVYALHRPRDENIFLKPEKLLGVITEDEIVVALDDAQTFATDGLYLFGVRADIDSKFIMAVLNSRLFIFIYRLLAIESGRQVKPAILVDLPISTIDASDRKQKALHDRLVNLVRQMLSLHASRAKRKTAHERTAVERQIAATDREIDALVYELYGLSDEEIRLVEEATAR